MFKRFDETVSCPCSCYTFHTTTVALMLFLIREKETLLNLCTIFVGICPSSQDDKHLQNLAVLARVWWVSTALPLLTSLRELVEPSFVVVLYTLVDGRAPDNSVLQPWLPNSPLTCPVLLGRACTHLWRDVMSVRMGVLLRQSRHRGGPLKYDRRPWDEHGRASVGVAAWWRPILSGDWLSAGLLRWRPCPSSLFWISGASSEDGSCSVSFLGESSLSRFRCPTEVYWGYMPGKY